MGDVQRAAGGAHVLPRLQCLGGIVQRTVDEEKRFLLSNTDDPFNAVLFIGGKAKPFGQCTPEELEEHLEKSERWQEQSAAWSEWYRRAVKAREASGGESS